MPGNKKITWGKNSVLVIKSPAKILHDALIEENLDNIIFIINNHGEKLHDSLIRTRNNIEFQWVIHIIYIANQHEITNSKITTHFLKELSIALSNVLGNKVVRDAMLIVKNSLQLSGNSVADSFLTILHLLETKAKPCETELKEELEESTLETEENLSNEEQYTEIEGKQHKDIFTDAKDEQINTNELNEHNTESNFLVKKNKKENNDNTDNSIELLLARDGFLSWIYSLPEDMQQYFLNTVFAQELIASLKEIYNTISPQIIADKFARLFNVDLEELHKYMWKYNNEISFINELTIHNHESDLSSLPDVNVVFEGDISNMVMILPTIGSGYIGLEPNFINAMDYNILG